MYEAQKAVDDMAVAINDHKVLAYVASHRLVRSTRQDEEQTNIKKMRIKVMEPTSSNEGDRQETERAPLRMTSNTEQNKEFSIKDTTLVIDEGIEDAIEKSGNSEIEDKKN